MEQANIKLMKIVLIIASVIGGLAFLGMLWTIVENAVKAIRKLKR